MKQRAGRDLIPTLIRVRPRPFTTHISRGRGVIATTLDGLIDDSPDHGLFVHETRLLSRYRWLIEGAPVVPVALSNVEQHTWMLFFPVFLPLLIGTISLLAGRLPLS